MLTPNKAFLAGSGIRLGILMKWRIKLSRTAGGMGIVVRTKVPTRSLIRTTEVCSVLWKEPWRCSFQTPNILAPWTPSVWEFWSCLSTKHSVNCCTVFATSMVVCNHANKHATSMKISDPGFLLTYTLNMYILLYNHYHGVISRWVTSWGKEQKSVFYDVECQLERNIIKKHSQLSCVIGQCHPPPRGWGLLVIVAASPIVSQAYQALAGCGGCHSLLSLNALSFHSGQFISYQQAAASSPTAATWHRFGLCSRPTGTRWQNQIQVSIIMGTAEAACSRGLDVLPHLAFFSLLPSQRSPRPLPRALTLTYPLEVYHKLHSVWGVSKGART